MNLVHHINNDNFQLAWAEAIEYLNINHWECWNLVVQIKNPNQIDVPLHRLVNEYTKEKGLLSPKDVAYTIFPYNLYKGRGSASELYRKYDRLYEWSRHRAHSGWGTYFRRMVHYESGKEVVNQLDNIINAINNRENTMRAAYTIVIEKPGTETIRRMGAPCLNYIAVQIQPGEPSKLGLLCTYRNHDFLNRAYGNYWGLCLLLCFLAEETGMAPSFLTCISSHAYVENRRTELLQLARSIYGNRVSA
jgi:thymidylate synthase